MNGVVYRLLMDKGYGFIRGEDGRSRFFHCRDVDESLVFDLLQEGQHVSFVSMPDGEHDNKLRAKQVTRV